MATSCPMARKRYDGKPYTVRTILFTKMINSDDDAYSLRGAQTN